MAQGCAAGRQARGLREAAGDERRRSRRELVELAAAHPAQAPAVNYNVRFYPLCLEARELVAAGDLGGGPQRHRQLRAGLAALSHRLQLARAGRGGRRAARRRRHRHALDGPRSSSITGLRGRGRSAPTWPRSTRSAEAAHGRGRDVHRQAGEGRRQATRAGRDHDRRLRLRPASASRAARAGRFDVSQVTAGRKNCLRYEIAGTEGALAWDSEAPERAVDRPSRAGRTRSCCATRPCCRPPRGRCTNYPGGHNEGFPDTFKQLFRAFYELHREGRTSRRPAVPDVRRRPPRGRALRGDRPEHRDGPVGRGDRCPEMAVQ